MANHLKSPREIDERLEKLNRKSRLSRKLFSTGLLTALGSGVLVAVLAMLAEELLEHIGVVVMVLVPTGFVLIIIGAAISSKIGHERSRIQNSFTPIALEQAMDRVDQFRDKELDKNYYKQELGLPDFDLCIQYNYLGGVLRKIPLEMESVTLEREDLNPEDDDTPGTKYEVVFSGVMVACRHTLQIEEDFTLTQYAEYFGGLKTESEEFNKTFAIHSSRGIDVFRLLTPQYMEKLLEASRQHGRIYAVRFCKDGTLLIVLRGRSVLPSEDSGDTVSEMIRHIVDNLDGIANAIEALELPIQRED